MEKKLYKNKSIDIPGINSKTMAMQFAATKIIPKDNIVLIRDTNFNIIKAEIVAGNSRSPDSRTFM